MVTIEALRKEMPMLSNTVGTWFCMLCFNDYVGGLVHENCPAVPKNRRSSATEDRKDMVDADITVPGY